MSDDTRESARARLDRMREEVRAAKESFYASGGAPREQPPLPPLRQMAANLFAAIVDPGKKLPPEDIEARLAVCFEGRGLPDDQKSPEGHCDRFRPSDARCGSASGCGCAVTVKIERDGRAWDCPLGRWPKLGQSS